MSNFKDEDNEESTSSLPIKRKEPEWFEIDDSHNTYVYVEGLPTDIEEEDFINLMKKYGIIKKKAILGNPFNIKLYKNQDGTLKGDGMCCYERIESVELAMELLNDYHYDEKHKLKCSRGTFQLKGAYDPSKKPRIDNRIKIKHKKVADKLLSWDSNDKSLVKQKKVILKNMFTPQEIVEDASLILDVKEDVETKCSEFNCEPKKVEIFDKHEEGVVAVTFDNFEQAESCIKALNNQYYAGRIVTAQFWDGKTKYKIKETDDETQERVEKWHHDIETNDD